MPREVDYTGEGQSDEVVARKLILSAGGIPGVAFRRLRKGAGKSNLDARLSGLNAGAPFGRPVLVLRDLDADARCPGELVRTLLPTRHSNLLLRICVHEVEAWLVADRIAYAKYIGLPARHLPRNPETIPRLKAHILDLAHDKGAIRLRKHLAETRKRGVPDWAGLGEWHADFARMRWDPLRADGDGTSRSLSNALHRLRNVIRGS